MLLRRNYNNSCMQSSPVVSVEQASCNARLETEVFPRGSSTER